MSTTRGKTTLIWIKLPHMGIKSLIIFLITLDVWVHGRQLCGRMQVSKPAGDGGISKAHVFLSRLSHFYPLVSHY
jgi:hypothetical protein